MTYRGAVSSRAAAAGKVSLGALVAVAGAAALANAGCYKPSLVDGKLLCGPANACPDDYACVEGHCWRGGVVPDGGSTDDGPSLDLACNMPVPGCTPSGSGACDPVCQTGSCKCDEKCTTSSSGVAACVKWKGVQKVFETCTITDYGSPSQNDDCAPGSICLHPDPDDARGAWCFAFCESDDDCPGSRCVSRAVVPTAPPAAPPTAKVCDVPFTPCDPFMPTSSPTTSNGCPGDRPYCYLTSPDPSSGASRTVCEYKSGGRGVNEGCTWSRDCYPGLVCPRVDGEPGRRGVGSCTAPCVTTSSTCTIGSCQAYGSNYGYCN